MIYVFTLIDKPQMGDLRQRIRPEHKEYLAAMADRMAFAGPLTTKRPAPSGRASCCCTVFPNWPTAGAR